MEEEIFCPVGELNRIRREALEQLQEACVRKNFRPERQIPEAQEYADTLNSAESIVKLFAQKDAERSQQEPVSYTHLLKKCRMALG